MTKTSKPDQSGQILPPQSILSQSVLGEPLIFPDTPARFTLPHVQRFFVWAAQQNASDITIQTGDRIWLEVHGKMHRVTQRILDNNEVLDILVSIYGNEAPKARLSGNADMDFAYQVQPTRDTRYRFRVNAVGIKVRGGPGVQITCRPIASSPPTLESMNLHPDIIQNLFHRQGMILVTGATGSGKTTLLASIIRHFLEDPNGHRKIITFESPIEYTFEDIENPTTSIAQTEIGSNLPSFVEGTRNSLRRAPKIIMLGEARDAETIGEAVTVSMTGHLLYTTIHTNNFAATIRRMVSVFNEDRNSMASDIISSLRMVVSQRLVPDVYGKRTALREFVVFNDNIVDYMLDNGIENIVASSREMLRQHGWSFLQDARDKYHKGLIPKSVLREMERDAISKERDAKQKTMIAVPDSFVAGSQAPLEDTSHPHQRRSTDAGFLGPAPTRDLETSPDDLPALTLKLSSEQANIPLEDDEK